MLKIFNVTNILFFAILLLATFLQSSLDLHSDIAYLSHVAQLILDGKKYGIDIFETNPPLILYIYTPAIIASHWLNIPSSVAIHAEIFCLIIISFFSCKSLLNKIGLDSVTQAMIMLTIALSFLIAPSNQFGQREHVATILTLPYFFNACLRLDKNQCGWKPQLLIGLMAGIGFSIKPYFLFPLVLIELFLMIHKRNIFSWLQIIPITIGTIMVSYLISTYLIFPGYFDTLLPIISHFYFLGIKEGLDRFIYNPLILFIFSSCLLSILSYKHLQYRKLTTTLTIATLGFIISFVVTHTTWFYHILPALILATLLVVLIISDLVVQITHENQSTSPLSTISIITTLSLIILFLPIANPVLNYHYFATLRHDDDYTNLVNTIINSKKPRTISCFSAATTEECFPLVYDVKGIYASRFPFYWWMRGEKKLKANQPNQYQAHRQEVAFLIKTAIEDLKKYKTQFIVFNKKRGLQVLGEDFSFPDYFQSHDPSFRDIWQHYRVKLNLEQFILYERQPD